VLIALSGLFLFAQSSGLWESSIDWASVHQGDWLGMPGRLLWVIVSLLLVWLIVGGLWSASSHKKNY